MPWPTLFIQTSIRPNSAIDSLTTRRTSSRRVTSATITCAPAPHFAATAPSAPAPRCPRAAAAPAPLPPLAPVITTTFSFISAPGIDDDVLDSPALPSVENMNEPVPGLDHGGVRVLPGILLENQQVPPRLSVDGDRDVQRGSLQIG